MQKSTLLVWCVIGILSQAYYTETSIFMLLHGAQNILTVVGKVAGSVVSGKPDLAINQLVVGAGMVVDNAFKDELNSWIRIVKLPLAIGEQIFGRMKINEKRGCAADICVHDCPSNNFLYYSDTAGCQYCRCNGPNCPNTACQGTCAAGLNVVVTYDAGGCLQCICQTSTQIRCPADACMANGCSGDSMKGIWMDDNGCNRCKCYGK